MVTTQPPVDDCGPSLSAKPLPRDDADRLAETLKAIAHPARLQLLSLIMASENGEACVCDLIEPVGLSQPTVSHHLKLLTNAGLVTRSQRGQWAWFAVVPERLREIRAVLQ
ncbi:helix-turn-helix transcriptional regulator [Frankia sp. CNm7]|nr:helix-turn-helix transcriptional regulator [Frankia nepalensis]MBL7513853.1 helix-turn-helix transcriptional regulator [Frankia nepalensis]MBL7518381.1 helix-turn-helix transcriptional regulator [Frankia nepalensis]